MNESIPILPDAASTSASEVDLLSLTLLSITVVFSVGIACAIGYFALQYWHTRDVNRKLHESVKAHWQIELTWSLIPLIILMVMFSWGADMFVRYHEPPDNPIEINVVAKQWMWKIGHESGPREINALHIPIGRPVRLTMISEDVIHSFYVPAFRNKQDVLPGRYTTMWFEATKPGTYHLFCAEFCGTNHSRMIGQVIVQSPADHAAWLESQPVASAAERGRRLMDSSGCLQCHGSDGNRFGPPLNGLFGRQVVLKDGSRHTVDESYIRRAILEPQTQMRAGFQPIMPSFDGKLTPEQVLDIMMYLKSVADADGPVAGPGPDTASLLPESPHSSSPPSGGEDGRRPDEGGLGPDDSQLSKTLTELPLTQALSPSRGEGANAFPAPPATTDSSSSGNNSREEIK